MGQHRVVITDTLYPREKNWMTFSFFPLSDLDTKQWRHLLFHRNKCIGTIKRNILEDKQEIIKDNT